MINSSWTVNLPAVQLTVNSLESEFNRVIKFSQIQLMTDIQVNKIVFSGPFFFCRQYSLMCLKLSLEYWFFIWVGYIGNERQTDAHHHNRTQNIYEASLSHNLLHCLSVISIVLLLCQNDIISAVTRRQHESQKLIAQTYNSSLIIASMIFMIK